jgi:hypothetical protein
MQNIIKSPCFDEPSYKSVFYITLEHPEKSIAVSNFGAQVISKLNQNQIEKKINCFEFKEHCEFCSKWPKQKENNIQSDI